jgi:hypothetical protein
MSKLGKLIDLASCLAREPRLTLSLLAQVPTAVRGAGHARQWKHEHPFVPDPSRRPGNPIERICEARITGRGIWKWNHYFDAYHRHFEKFIGTPVNILEIGVYSGGSLDLWKSYFGKDCRVYGVDIQEACKSYQDERTEIWIGDQGKREFWQSFKSRVPALDIVIDDGSHEAEDQIVTLQELLPSLRPGGVYLCEDLHGIHRFSAFVAGMIGELNRSEAEPQVGRPTTELQAWIRSIHSYPFMTVFEKAEQPLKELIAPKRGSQWQPFL